MTAIELIARAIGDAACDFPAEPESGVCAVTGEFHQETYPLKKLIGPSFTNRDLLHRPDSDRVSKPAWIALKYRPQRCSSWFCDGREFIALKRIDVRQHVFGGHVADQWSGYVTTSYKKHGCLHTPVNQGISEIWRFENETVDCSDREKLRKWWRELNSFLDAGIPRKVIETGRTTPMTMKFAGIKISLEFDNWAADKYRDPLFKFLCYLLPSIEERKTK